MNPEDLVARYADQIRLSAINSGSTLYDAKPRGRFTFCSIDQYPYEERLRRRRRSEAIAELAVIGGVPDIAEMVVSVTEWRPNGTRTTLFEEPGTSLPNIQPS